MSDDCPFELKVLDLLRTQLSRESTILSSADVLGSNLNFLIKHCFHCGNVDCDWNHNDLNFVLVVLHHIECFGAQISNRFN